MAAFFSRIRVEGKIRRWSGATARAQRTRSAADRHHYAVAGATDQGVIERTEVEWLVGDGRLGHSSEDEYWLSKVHRICHPAHPCYVSFPSNGTDCNFNVGLAVDVQPAATVSKPGLGLQSRLGQRGGNPSSELLV